MHQAPGVVLDGAAFQEMFLTMMSSKAYEKRQKKLFKGILKEKVGKISKTVGQIKSVLQAQNKEIEELHQDDLSIEDTIDVLDQKTRANKIRISGEQEINGKEDIVKTVLHILDKVECQMSPDNIESAHRIGPKAEGKNRPILVQFTTLKDKRKAYKSRRVLKKKYKAGIWMAEDLTPQRSNTMYHARRLKKAKLIFEYWSHEGEIFVKPTEHTDPIRLRNVTDLLKFIPSTSTLDKPTRLTKLKAAPVPLQINDEDEEEGEDTEESDQETEMTQ